MAGEARAERFERAAVTSRAQVVDHIRLRRTLSRVELARITGLSAPAVSQLVRRLVAEGLVTEVGRGVSTGGKPRTLLRIEPSARFVAGIQLGFRARTYVLLNFAGDMVLRWRRPGRLDATRPADIATVVERELAELLAGASAERLAGVGVAAAGPLARDNGFLSAPPSMREWIGFPIRDALEERLGVPVLLDNDASAAAAGVRLTTTHDETALAVLFMGDGVGGGLRVGGDVFAGTHGNAAEVGHICVDPRGPECWCGSAGCLEAIAGPAAVIAQAKARGLLSPQTEASNQEAFSALARMALQGEPGAAQLLAESARWMALGAQALVAMFDPQLLVLTGPSFAVAGTLYLPQLRRRVAESAFSRVSGVEVAMDERGHDAAATGAAVMMLRSETVAGR